MSADPLDITSVQEADLDAVTALVKVLQWPHRREDIALFMRLGTGRAAKDAAGTLRGVALWWGFEPAAARLGLVMVSPDVQRRGIGRRLVEQVLADSAGRSMRLLATEAGKPLYDTLGFVAVGACRQYQGIYAGEPEDDAGIRAARSEDLATITALDTTAFGAGRAATLRVLMAAGRTAVLEDGAGVAGYAIERDFGRGTVVGPIVAAHDADAIRLFKALARPGFVRVDTPVGSERFPAHLVAQGLAAAGADSLVMVRGTWPDPAAGARIFALSSHALG